MSDNGTKQVSDFPATGAIANTDVFYSQNSNTLVEQKTTAQQLQAYVVAPIGGSTLTDAGALTGNETIPVGRNALLQTTMKKMAAYIMSNLAPQRQSIPVVNAGTVSYNTNGYTPGAVNIFVAGIRVSPDRYVAMDGTTIQITDATLLAQLTPGMTIDLDSSVTINSTNTATVASVAALDPANQPAVGTLLGTELISIRQGVSGLFQATLAKLLAFVPTPLKPADGTATVSVTGIKMVVFSQYATATNFLNFTGGVDGQTIKVLGSSKITIVQSSSTFVTPSGGNVVLANNTMYSFTSYGGVWYMG